jgi:hypothetical protein
MKNLTTFLAITMVIFMSSSCREGSCDPLNSFNGITQRDDSGKLIKEDKMDWKFGDKWEEREQSLFPTNLDNTCIPPPRYTIIAYPNPTSGSFNVMFNKGDYTKVDLRLVDFDCRTLISIDDFEDNSIGLEPANIGKKGIVRLYYRFVEDGCEYQGHGDIRIE